MELIEIAKEAIHYSYSPYSNFKVGAALKTKDGKIFIGCNIDNVSFSLSICAERVATFKAISEGYRNFESIAIVSSDGKPTYPCGACRQVLAEYNTDIKIYVDNPLKEFTLDSLIPYTFTFKHGNYHING
jgi:cytidine deaminase